MRVTLLFLSLALPLNMVSAIAGTPSAANAPLPYCVSSGDIDSNVLSRVGLLPSAKAHISEIPPHTPVQLSTGHRCITSKRYQTFKVSSGTYPIQIGGNFVCPSGYTVTGFALLENPEKK